MTTHIDIKGMERREWHLWYITLFLMLVMGGIGVIPYFYLAESSLFDVPSYSTALWGVGPLVILFFAYTLNTRTVHGRLKNLVVEISAMLSSNVELDFLLDSFAKKIPLAANTDFCQIALWADGNLMIRAAHAVKKIDWVPHKGKGYLLAKMPVTATVIENLQTHTLRRRDLPNLSPEDAEFLTGGFQEWKGLLVMPIASGGKGVGAIVMGVTGSFAGRRFSSSGLAWIQAIVRHVAAAIAHAALIDKVKATSESLLKATMDATGDGILVLDRRGKIVNFNQQFVRMWKVPEEALQNNQNILEWILGQLVQRKTVFQADADPLVHPDVNTDHLLELKDGRYFQYFSQPQWINGISVGRVWSYRNVTDVIQTKVQLEQQAITDPLTGLYNRRYFDFRVVKELGRANRKQESLAFVLCDLDHFKEINDTRGHAAGDQVLIEVAKTINESIRATDLVFRWGGDEFMIVFSEATREGIQKVVNRIRYAIDEIGKRMDIPLDCSAGVAFYPGHSKIPEELIRLSDHAMYMAKRGTEKTAFVMLPEEKTILHK